MGHLVGKDLYQKLGRKLDGLQVRVPSTPELSALLEELYSPEDAALIVQMPYLPATVDRIAALTGRDPKQLECQLDALCEQGLVMDLWAERTGRKKYAISPLFAGFFEFSMMRASPAETLQRRARLFHAYFESGAFFEANVGGEERVFAARTLPWEDSVNVGERSEVLDYERATHIIEQSEIRSLGVCSCRHEKHHLGQRDCDVPLQTCTSFGAAADYLVRHGMARSASRAELLEGLARSRELGLVLTADNVQHRVTFVCHCCGCCCNLLRGITEHGYPGTIVSSNYAVAVDERACQGCGKCTQACPVDALELRRPYPDAPKKLRRPKLDLDRCLGCGVCVVRCPSQALSLVERPRRVYHPSNTFERVILQSLERGTLQNLVFDNPQSKSQDFLRGVVGGFLRLSPVRRALMSDAMRSRFLRWLDAIGRRRGHEDVTEI